MDVRHARRPAHEVSIRSRPEDREKASLAELIGWTAVRFNPLPARRPGESRPSAGSADISAFQSAPGPKTGRKVSAAVILPTASRCFNPLPARRPGERTAASQCGHRCDVSIRSRPEDREKGAVHGPSTRRWTFQSAPGPKTGRKGGNLVADAQPERFQSAPGPKTGRKRRSRCRRRPPASFNPLPARRPGERLVSSGVPADPFDPGLVSIRSRPEDREKGHGVAVQSRADRFQSAPGPKTGRKLPARSHRRASRSFQSAPGPKTGRKGLISTHSSETSCEPDPANPIAMLVPNSRSLKRSGHNSLGLHLLWISRRPRRCPGAGGSRTVHHPTPVQPISSVQSFVPKEVPTRIARFFARSAQSIDPWCIRAMPSEEVRLRKSMALRSPPAR